MNRRGLTAGLGAMVLASRASLAASTYPARPVTLLVPYAAGGSSDVLARLIGERLSKALGQQVVVENRGGAGSRIGIEAVAKSAPDGYTLLLADMPHTIIPAIQQGVRYDPVQDFTSIGLIGTASMLLFAGPGLKATSVQEFVSEARRAPGTITVASGGNGSTTHLASELFQSRLGIKLAHVAFRGAGPAINDVMAGHVQCAFGTLATTAGLLDGGSVRALAIAADDRIASRPTIPTFKELGIDFVVGHWWGVLAPRGVPGEIAERLTTELNAILRTPEMGERLQTLGVAPTPGDAESFRSLLVVETARWVELVRRIGIVSQ